MPKTLFERMSEAQSRSHPFTPDVVAYLQRAIPVFERAFADPIGLVNQVGRMDEYGAMLAEARQILAAAGMTNQ